MRPHRPPLGVAVIEQHQASRWLDTAMIHPNTELRLINEQMGYGVFATHFIPKGTIVYARCKMDQTFEVDDPLLSDPQYADILERYTYTEPSGTRVLCWDIGKYVNHCCHPSTLTTGYGFEIALRDLWPGQEITDDYGIFNCGIPIPLICEQSNCRGMLVPGDFDRHVASWDQRIKQALPFSTKVEQPLWDLLAPKTIADLQHYLDTGRGYRSISTQKALQPPSMKSA